MRYISLLRGINVLGQKSIKMNDLKELYEKLGMTGVTTYIQSGNVVFSAKKVTSAKAMTELIEQELFRRFCFNVSVIVRTSEEMVKTYKGNPFLSGNDTDHSKLHVTFLSELPESVNIEKIKTIEFLPDRFVISGKDIYLYCPGGYGKTKLSNTFFENRLKVTATTRNWNTVAKLNDLAKA